MMTPESILGKKEDQRLEFKAAEALKNPGKLAREVVAMLNAGERSDIWVGVREEEEVAVALEGIEKPEAAKRSLEDALIDRIEPPPSGKELTVKVVDVGESKLIRVGVVGSAERRPYAAIEGASRYFGVRVGGRIRTMSREEILSPPDAKDAKPAAIELLADERSEARDRLAREYLWLAIEPVRSLDLEMGDEIERVREALSEPHKTGNRRAGWHFLRSGEPPRLRSGEISWGFLPYFRGCWRDSGGLRFEMRLDLLGRKARNQELWPPTLFEYLTSAFRLASFFLGSRHRDDDEVLADLAVFGLSGWKLRIGGDLRFPIGFETYSEEDFFLTRPLVFPASQVRDEPDRCGYRLVRRVYEAFGMEETAMPPYFDEATGRLSFPE